MSIIEQAFIDRLNSLQAQICAAIEQRDESEMFRRLGKLQGYLAGLCHAGELDEAVAQKLEDESVAVLHWHLNAMLSSRGAA